MHLTRRYTASCFALCITLALLAAPALSQVRQHDNTLNRGIHLRLSGSLHYPQQGYENEGPLTPDIKRLFDNNRSVQGEVELFLSPGISISGMLLFLRANDGKNEDIDYICVLGPCPSDKVIWSNAFSLVVPELRIKYHRPYRRSDLYIGAGAGYGFGRISIKRDFRESVERERYAAQGLDAALFAGFSYKVYNSLAIFTEAGYRKLDTGGFKADEDNRTETDLPIGNFTGPFSTFGLSFRL